MGNYFDAMLELAFHIAGEFYKLTGLMYNPETNIFTAYYASADGVSHLQLERGSENVRMEEHQKVLEANHTLGKPKHFIRIP